MGIFNQLFGSYKTSSKFAAISEDQRGAFIDVLVLAIGIDGEIAPEERATLLKELKAIKWSKDYDPEIYLERAIEQGITLGANREELRGYLVERSNRLSELWLREEAYYISARLVCADREVMPEEHMFLQVLTEALALPPERQAYITEKVLKEGMI